MSDKIFINLTNGIEALDKYNLDIEKVNFIRIQSSHFEAHKYDDIILDLDHNFLMSLALGFKCIIYDFGARADSSKAIRLGIPWIKFVLTKRWYDKSYTPIVNYKNISYQFNKYFNGLSNRTKKKIDYYKKYILADDVNVEGVCSSTLMDNNLDFYKSILDKKINLSAVSQSF